MRHLYLLITTSRRRQREGCICILLSLGSLSRPWAWCSAIRICMLILVGSLVTCYNWISLCLSRRWPCASSMMLAMVSTLYSICRWRSLIVMASRFTSITCTGSLTSSRSWWTTATIRGATCKRVDRVMQACTLSIEWVVWRLSRVIKGSTTSSSLGWGATACSSAVSCMWSTHSRSIVMSCFDWSATYSTHLESTSCGIVILCRGIQACRSAKARWSWWLSNLHPWREGVLKEYTSRLMVLHAIISCSCRIGIYGGASNSGVGTSLAIVCTTDAGTRRHWVMMRRANFVSMLEMVRWDSFSVRMLLCTCSSWVEEVVHTLECSTSLPRYLTIFANGILQLYIWKSGKHLVSIDTWINSLIILTWHQTLIDWLALLHLCMSRSLGSNWIVINVMSWSSHHSSWRSRASRWERQHVLVMSVTASENVVCSCISWARHSTNIAMIWYAVSSIRAILWSFDHWWQLKLLVVGIVTFLSRISLSVSQDFLIELYNLMYLISILRILLIVCLIFNNSINLRIITLH